MFSLAEAEGFALAGGGALIAHEVVDCTTRDLDCFDRQLELPLSDLHVVGGGGRESASSPVCPGRSLAIGAAAHV